MGALAEAQTDFTNNPEICPHPVSKNEYGGKSPPAVRYNAYDFLYTLELVFSVAHFARKTDTISSLHHETAFAEEADSILPCDLIALI